VFDNRAGLLENRSNAFSIGVQVQAVPEPATLMLMLTFVASVWATAPARRRMGWRAAASRRDVP
jgi:hypothetical protein